MTQSQQNDLNGASTPSNDTESQKYNVLFCGDLAEGFSPDEVKQKLIRMFNVPEQLIDGAYSGTPLMVKNNVDYQTALRYKNIFEKAGTVCRIEAVKRDQEEKTETLSQQLESRNIVRSRNGEIEITKPKRWTLKECEEDTNIQIVNRPQDLCFTIISEQKTEFEEGLDYMDFSKIACDSVLTKDTSYEKVSGPVGVAINGMRGVQYEIVGKSEGQRLKTIHVTLDGKKYFHVILASCLESTYDLHKPIFEEILLSFYERAGKADISFEDA